MASFAFLKVKIASQSNSPNSGDILKNPSPATRNLNSTCNRVLPKYMKEIAVSARICSFIRDYRLFLHGFANVLCFLRFGALSNKQSTRLGRCDANRASKKTASSFRSIRCITSEHSFPLLVAIRKETGMDVAEVRVFLV